MFGFVRNMAGYVFLGMSFIAKCIKIILPTKRKAVLPSPPPVLIPTVHQANTDKREKRKDKLVIEVMNLQDFEQELVRTPRTITLD